ncbi:MAG: TRAP transporter permease [bacterium]
MRKLEGKSGLLVAGIAIIASAFHIYTAAFGMLEPRLQRGYHLLFLLPLVFLLYPAKKDSKSNKISIMDMIFAVLSVLPSLLIIIDSSRLSARWEHVTPLLTKELILGTLMIILLLEAVRRAVTPMLSYVILASLLYMRFGMYFPGIFYHRGASWAKIVEMMYLLAQEGIYGMLTGISATFIFIFVLFGSFIVYSGVGDFFTKFASAVAGKVRGGPALIAVISSAFFGTLTGSSVANVLSTGSFTIPLMKRTGFKPEFAGAVEAAASTGGQYMPPIMGAAAFIMAEVVGVPYITVAMSATISAILYYLSVGMMVYFRARKDEIEGLSLTEVPPLREVLKMSYLVLPLFVLFFMLVKGYSPIMAGLYAIIGTVLITWVNPKQGMKFGVVLEALAQGGKNAVLVAVACAATGMVVSVVTYTGIGLTFTNSIVSLSSGNIILAMFFIMIASLILGHGAPTSATYILVATVGAGALVRLGADIIAAHLFCLYYAVIADITPPVAVAAYAGASVANSDPISTGIEAFKLAAAGFIVPFLFVLNPALVLRGPLLTTIHATITALIGVIALSGAMQGWFIKKLVIYERGLLLIAALSLLIHGIISDIVGAIILGIIIIRVMLTNKIKKQQTITSEKNI